jgi:hypothetical protein
MANLATVVWQDHTHAVLLALHGAATPSDAEWNQYCEAIPGVLAHPNGVGMVLTDGGAPTAAQRSVMRKKGDGATRRNAVVTDKTIVRGVITAISWFNPGVCAFEPREFSEAFTFVGLRGGQITNVCTALKQLDLELSSHSRVLAEALRNVGTRASVVGA